MSTGTEDGIPAPKQQKTTDSESKGRGGSQYQKHLKKMSEVELIIEDLEEKHSSDGQYSAEQIRVWAHLLHMKKHDSYSDPPNKPFFRHSRSAKSLVSGSSASTDGMSPAKNIQVRMELIEQLDKWHALMERGAIDLQQFKELQDTILNDIKNY